jgi:asparagine N-glycosylation enzyme membrane subunit Stt3
VTVLFTFALALPHVERARQFTRISALWAGGALGLYLLAWGSGAFLIAVIGVWLLVCVPLARTTSDLTRAATVTAISCAVALVLVVAFQDPAMLRYGSQVLGLAGLGAAALAIQGATQLRMALPPKRVVLGAIAAVALVTAAAAATFARGVVSEALIDVGRLAPDASRMGVLEARPLFMYSGNWNWLQPWLFFRTGFFIGVIALIPFTARVWRQRLMADSLLLMFAMATLVATIGQNRFGYYFVTACAVLGGWLAVELLDWAGVPHAGNPTPRARTKMPLAREVAVVVVAGGMFAPNLSPRVLLAERTASFPTYWRDTMRWLREQTPPPFQHAAGAGGDYYYARYPKDVALAPDYSVMSWWDQGYWITQQARRVPVANPTQERAPNAARFYSATDEARALDILRAERSRYVVSDYELPFRRLADGTIMGRFQTIVDWTGAAHAPFYEVIYRRSEGGGWNAAWIFHEPYYRSMAFRLSALGGVGATPANSTSVITVADRVDTNGVRFRELLTEHTYATYEAARIAAQSTTGGIVVGLDPWQSAFPIEPLQSLVQVHAATTPEQTRSEAPWVRVFEVR